MTAAAGGASTAACLAMSEPAAEAAFRARPMISQAMGFRVEVGIIYLFAFGRRFFEVVLSFLSAFVSAFVRGEARAQEGEVYDEASSCVLRVRDAADEIFTHSALPPQKKTGGGKSPCCCTVRTVQGLNNLMIFFAQYIVCNSYRSNDPIKLRQTSYFTVMPCYCSAGRYAIMQLCMLAVIVSNHA